MQPQRTGMLFSQRNNPIVDDATAQRRAYYQNMGVDLTPPQIVMPQKHEATTARTPPTIRDTSSNYNYDFESPQTKATRIAKEQQDALTARNEAFQTSQMEKQQEFAISEREKSQAFQKEMQALNTAQSGGGGMSVICTRIHELGHLSDEIYALDNRFGETLWAAQPEIIIGYHAWATTYVSWLHGNTWISRLLIKFSIPLTQAWACEMATYYGLEKHPNRMSEILGKMFMAIGMPLCQFIGQCKMQGAKNATN